MLDLTSIFEVRSSELIIHSRERVLVQRYTGFPSKSLFNNNFAMTKKKVNNLPVKVELEKLIHLKNCERSK